MEKELKIHGERAKDSVTLLTVESNQACNDCTYMPLASSGFIYMYMHIERVGTGGKRDKDGGSWRHMY